MTSLFFFGTMQHRALFDAVAGDCSHIRLSPAELADYSVQAVLEGPFPTLVAKQGTTAPGLLAEGVTDAELARLDYYEGAFGYVLRDVVLADGRAARVYMAQQDLWTANGAWSLALWAEDWGPLSVLAADEVMGYMGQKPPEDIAQMFPMIRARAWSTLNAAQGGSAQDRFRGRVDITERRRMYAEYFALDEFDLSHERFDGSMTPQLMRAVFVAADAAHVLPYDPVRDRVLVIEQMRLGPLARGDAALWQLEPIAGRLDPGETPQEAVRREAIEETGVSIGALHAVGETYSSPGNSTEFHYTYVGIADLPDDAGGVGGLDAEEEDIRSHVMDFDTLMAQCDTQRIVNAPLVLIAYWLARHRDRLRASS
ncbi:MAG: NUDIX domain-containing protein [Paracoccaceae bacterium]|nr:NUDIX domain-containing protein [Paracoccaceae bacterium]